MMRNAKNSTVPEPLSLLVDPPTSVARKEQAIA